MSYKIALDVRKIGQKQTGDETYITNLVKQLIRLDQQNEYYLLTDELEHEARVERVLGLLPDNFQLLTLKPSSKLRFTRVALSRFVKKEGIDLLHVQYITPQKLPRTTKLITTIHDASFARFGDQIRFWDRFLLNRFIPRSIKRADRVIAVSNFTGNELKHFYPAEMALPDGRPEGKLAVIHNGVDSGRFQDKSRFLKNYLERLDAKYSLGERYLFHVSSLQPRKNVPFLMEAFRGYLHKNRDSKVNLVIAGGRGYNYDKEIDQVLCDANLKQRVRMLGYVKDEELPALFAGATAYVSPSLYEGFDLPLVEAMQSGVPVLASRGSCHEEVVGESGIFFDPLRLGDLVEKLEQFFKSRTLVGKLKSRGKKQARNFSWEKCARETRALYLRLLAEDNR